MAEASQCGATKGDGARCLSTIGVRDTPDGPRCPLHDPERAPDLHVKGGKGTSKTRVVTPEDVPPLKTLDDAVLAAAWLFEMSATGQLDPATAREVSRAITTFKDAVNKADMLKRITALEKRARERDRTRGRHV